MSAQSPTETSSSSGGLDPSSAPAAAVVPVPHRDRINEAYFYAMGVVIPIGLSCNVFCLFVFTMSAGLRRSSTGHYLTALGGADAGFLVGDLIRWMNLDYRFLRLRFVHTSNVACQYTHWLRYSAKLVSAWITVAIVVERLITIAAPLKVSTISTSFRAKFVIATVALLGIALTSFPLWTIGIDEEPTEDGTTILKCLVLAEEEYELWSMVILRVGTLALPSIIITISTVVILYNLAKAHRRRKIRLEGQSSLPRGVPVSTCMNFAKCRKEMTILSRRSMPAKAKSPDRQLTAMLLAVCFAFFCLRLPYTIVYYIHVHGKTIWPDDELHPSKTFWIFVLLRSTDVLATSNYVVNFFLYCLCGTYFRQQIRLVCRVRAKTGGALQLQRQLPGSLPELGAHSGKSKPSGPALKPTAENPSSSLFHSHL